MFRTLPDAIQYIFRTRRRLDGSPRGLDEVTRDTAPSRMLLELADLPQPAHENVVVAGSRGKGSVVAIMAKLLEALGCRVGMLTGPHLRHWNERIRIDGRMIPDADFLRILGSLSPHIDAVTASLDAPAYLSPQGIFLALALRYFAEQKADIALLEVGRGGRFDDIVVAPHRLSVIAPIMLEHTALLGSALERIAWHKAGVISRSGLAVSARQPLEATQVLQREADEQGATLEISVGCKPGKLAGGYGHGTAAAFAALRRVDAAAAWKVSARERLAGHPRC